MSRRLRGAVRLVALATALGGSPHASAGSLDVAGTGWVRGLEASGQPSWRDGGFGRLTEGADASGDSASAVRSQIHLGLDWKPSEVVLFHLHVLARQEPERGGGEGRVGVTEAFLQLRPELSPATSLRFRAGMFLPQTSRENTDPFWASPYTLTFSALNAWIGEEMRLTGVETVLIARSPGGSELQLSGSAFGGNDTLGALVAWRGWGLSDRLVLLGEAQPLPPLASLRPGGGFADQRDDGTRPIDELDDRIGWQVRTRWTHPTRALLQAAYADNRADRKLHGSEYAWRTRFGQAGGELHLGRAVTLVAEAAIGDTGMGPFDGPHVDVRFRVGYVLVSWGGEKARLSARYDRFENDDRDGTQEPNDERGSAWTVAAFWRPVPHLRMGLEWLDLRAQRPAAAFSGADADTDARRLTVELRLSF